ncbi:class I SAM-dependent methyltransferase [Brevibacillus dissolubilis]|uniref:class I SAM-dependent methyltransferase n=1 Tax=Brevibacillus dissolubilis TaxID=1844116 RepID=UPI001116B1AD|nr:SAM-dependent methyltransferase [Brevibacillus dissolubilis]
MNPLELSIQAEINQSENHSISFVRFMELALYHPRHGYYRQTRPKVGKDGDFYTSATVHPVFAETLADAVLTIWREQGIEEPVLVEAGGGTGHLMKHMLTHIQNTAPDVYGRMKVMMIEISGYHQELQRQALAEFRCPQVWYPTIEAAAEAESIEGVIVSNEWFDAFPVRMLDKTVEGWREVGVTWLEQEERFAEVHLDTFSGAREEVDVLEKLLVELPASLPVGMRIEVNTAVAGTMKAISDLLHRGSVITIDYGDRQEDLYHPSRRRGTLMCYHRHQASDNPYQLVGEQDITAHVNFSELIRRGEEVGLNDVSFQRQDQFLMQHGILHKAQSHNDRDPFTSQAMKRNRAIQQLLMPSGLGGMFRVLVQRKG